MTRVKRYICIILAAALLACVPGDISSLTGIGKSAKDGKAVYSPVARAADGEEITDPENQPAAQAKAKPRPMKRSPLSERTAPTRCARSPSRRRIAA